MSSSQVISILKEGELKDSGIVDHISQLIRSQLAPNNQLKGFNNIELLSYFLRTHSFEFKKLLIDH